MASQVTHEQLDQFFAPIVGTPDVAESFRTSLCANVDFAFGGSFFDTNPYFRLARGIGGYIDHAVDQIEDPIIAEDLARAGAIGAHLVACSLEVLGGAYATEAAKGAAPQQLKNVQTNANNAVKYVTGIAYANQATGIINRASLVIGKDPNRRWAALASRWQVSLWRLVGHNTAFSQESLSVKTDEEGQLDIGFRYPRRKAPQGSTRRCPAAAAKVEQDGKTRPAISVFGNIIGSVVVSEIYPRIITITD